VRVDLLYDNGKLLALGAQGTPGRLQLTVSAPATVRFRALAGQSGATQISAGNIIPAPGSSPDAARVAPPAPVIIDITP
jgi:hypothetical protein